MLINENYKLKEKLNIIDKELSNEFIKNVNNIITIDTIELRVNNLEIENKKLNEHIIILENNNFILQQNNKDLKQENRLIKEQLKYLTDKEIIIKTINVLQDLNAEYKLENNIKNNKLKLLRNKRNSVCHYLLDDDNSIIKIKKIEYIIDHLKTLDKNIKDIIENEFAVTINDIIDYIQPLLQNDFVNINDKDIEDIDEELLFFWKY
jgi:hypothetical protein